MWGHIAASSGDKDGFDERDEVAKKMTPAEIAEAEKLVSECVAKKYKGCQSTTTESATVATESPSTALSEARSLAQQGDADAQFNLGEMYYYGQGVPQNDKTALKWYTLAAEQGYAEAQFALAVMYLRGQGVITDNVYVYMWGPVSYTHLTLPTILLV